MLRALKFARLTCAILAPLLLLLVWAAFQLAHHNAVMLVVAAVAFSCLVTTIGLGVSAHWFLGEIEELDRERGRHRAR